MASTSAPAAAAPTSGSPGAAARRGSTLGRRLRASRQVRIGGAILGVLVFVAIFAPVITWHSPAQPNIQVRNELPSRDHPFGTDNLGRDIYSRVVFGSRVSLRIGLISVGIAFSLGVTLGLLAGYYPRFDNLIMRTMDVLLAFPGLLLAIAILGALGPSLTNAMIAVGIAATPSFVRISRSAVLRVRSQEYVDASRAIGATDGRIVLRHVLPNISSEVIVTTTLNMASAILAASVLSFLGLGAQPPTPEWGAMVFVAKDYLDIAPHNALFPILAIFVTVLGFNFLGDGLRDALDPRLYR
ncbi:MAG: ABC transporter permease [Armatimonadota bacterium]|nr:ABC transporter permease [Armatimonadota bacterium]